MKTNFKFFLSALTIAGFMTFSSCNNTPKDESSTDQENVTKKEYTCSMHPEIVQNEPGDCPKCKMALVEKTEAMDANKSEVKEMGEKQYTCSMHPDVIQNEPGVCPECKMDLVEKTEE